MEKFQKEHVLVSSYILKLTGAAFVNPPNTKVQEEKYRKEFELRSISIPTIRDLSLNSCITLYL